MNKPKLIIKRKPTVKVSLHNSHTVVPKDYEYLKNKPKINGVELSGNKTTEDLQISFNDLKDKPTIPTVPAINVSKVKDYLYETTFLDIDDDYAIEYFKGKKPHVSAGVCSSFIKNGRVYRYLDWTYDNNVEFIVRTPARPGRYAVTGISSTLPLTKTFVEGREYSDLYRLVPFYLSDGENEKGLVVCTNVVPLDFEPTTETIPETEKRAEICSVMLVRYLLDRYATAYEAVNALRNYISVFIPAALQEMGYEQHYLIADKDKAYCVEFIENAVVAIDVTEDPIITNFYLYGTHGIENGVYTPADVAEGHLPSSQGITPHGAGLERYNLIKNSDNPDLWYTNTYKRSTAPFWYSEYVGGDLTVDSVPSLFEDRVASYISAYECRTRDDEVKTWQTVHRTVYDFASKAISITVQESGAESKEAFSEYLTKAGTLQAIEEARPGKKVVISETGDVSVTVQANVFCEIEAGFSSLEITFAGGEEGRVSEFNGQFSTGDTVPTVSFPEGVSWVGGELPELEQNKTYQFSVLNNIGVVIGV